MNSATASFSCMGGMSNRSGLGPKSSLPSSESSYCPMGCGRPDAPDACADEDACDGTYGNPGFRTDELDRCKSISGGNTGPKSSPASSFCSCLSCRGKAAGIWDPASLNSSNRFVGYSRFFGHIEEFGSLSRVLFWRRWGGISGPIMGGHRQLAVGLCKAYASTGNHLVLYSVRRPISLCTSTFLHSLTHLHSHTLDICSNHCKESNLLSSPSICNISTFLSLFPCWSVLEGNPKAAASVDNWWLMSPGTTLLGQTRTPRFSFFH